MDHAACSDGVWHTLNQDDNAASILRAGFEAVPMLISRNLAADILESVPMAKAQIISNALQQAVQGDLRRRVDEELQSSSAMRMNMDACEPEKDHMWPFPVLIPPERLLTSSSSASW